MIKSWGLFYINLHHSEAQTVLQIFQIGPSFLPTTFQSLILIFLQILLNFKLQRYIASKLEQN